MPRLAARKLAVAGCTSQCACGVAKRGVDGAALIHSLLERGLNNEAVASLARQDGHEVSASGVGRHRQFHVRPWNAVDDAHAAAADVEPVSDDISDLEILRMVIKQGAKNVPHVKVDVKTLLAAMDMFYKMTQGSAFADMINALSAFGGDEEAVESGEVGEAPEAVDDLAVALDA